MKSYLYLENNQDSGKLAISNYVFQQIADESLKDLAEGEWKDGLCLKKGKKESKVTCEIDKTGIVRVNLSLVGYKGADMKGMIDDVQKTVYNKIYSMMEISNLKVDVLVTDIVSSEA